MANNTINDLYFKYVNKVGSTLERDRYFQYLFEMVQAGENELQQKYQVMHKVVDERWLSTIEESLDAINTIIEKPRRFVTTKEEVVPVALAKKITADSVRHLSMNTQFIASNEDGDIQPTRVLNISTEESYDLYENRFVYHLIQRLVTFIDKRTDVIFWATEDETQNTLSYTSKVDDAYEQIQYKIEMTIKNRQNFAENDADNMSVFMRIDRVRRMVMTLKNSAFCSLMAGCSKVRSPIQRTNLIMKDPYYRTCYKLWQFLESYDDVGYTIEVQDSALEFDEEYLIQMYINMITNYTVFKSLLETDSRNIDEPLAKKRKVVKPKFVKKIKEEFVDNCDIEDVEIRQVFLQEVTQAQLDAEAKLEEETQKRQEAEQALDDMDSQLIFYQQQVSNLMMQNQEAEVAAEAERQAKEEALAMAEQERGEKEAAISEAEAQLAEAKESEEKALEQAKVVAEELQLARQAKEEMEARFAEMQRELEAVKATAKQQVEEATTQLEETKQKARAQIEQTLEETKERVEQAKAQADAEIARTKAESEAEIAKTKAEADDRIAQNKSETEAEIAKTKAEAENRIAQNKSETEAEIARTKAEAKEQIERTENDVDNRISKVREEIAMEADKRVMQKEEEAKQQIAQIESQAADNIARAQAEANDIINDIQRKASDEVAAVKQEQEIMRQQFRDKESDLHRQLQETEKEALEANARALAAQEKADANTLSHYIISALNDRKRRNDKGGDDL